MSPPPHGAARWPNRRGSDWAFLLALALAKLLLHFLTNGRYGYFRDELYYVACGEHLAWGYVDQPPLIAVMAKAGRLLLGDSLFALRFFAAVAGAIQVFLAGWTARELGAQRFGQRVAALAVLAAPYYLAVDTFLSMNAFEQVFWTLCAYLVIRIVKGGNQKLWLWFGLVAGAALLNKYSILFFGFGLFVGLLLTPQREFLRSRWIWLAALVAGVIWLPNLAWQAVHGWPQWEVFENAQKYKSYAAPGEFLLGQVLLLHPLTFPIWLAGLYFYLSSPTGRPYRLLGWTYLVVLAAFLLLKAKVYYLAPAYPMLLASGGLVWERVIEQLHRPWLKPAVVALLVAGGMITAPYGLPVLSIETFLRYDSFLRFGTTVQAERDTLTRLPQLYADMLGWEELVAKVAGVYQGLSPQERSQCAILADDYGEAGAIDLLGGRHHLPKAISGHNNYYLWGPRRYSGEVVLSIGYPSDVLKSVFEQVEAAGTVAMPDGIPLPIFVCRKPKEPLQTAWPKFRIFM